MLSKLFPSIFPEYEPEKCQLCRILHITALRDGSDPEMPDRLYLTLEDPKGSRGILKIDEDSRLKIRAGDKVVAVTKQNKHFPFEMKVTALREIYLRESDTPITVTCG